MFMHPTPAVWPRWLAEAFAARGFTQLTPIQVAVLRPDLWDRDLRIASATGSGKTAAVAIALGQTLAPADGPGAVAGPVVAGGPTAVGAACAHSPARPRALILAPTRELALQLRREFEALYRAVPLRVACVVGGNAYRDERRALAREPAVLVATPGRLLDHLQRRHLRLDGIEAVALDEADRLLELGFKDELETILSACPASRRTLLISATFGDAVQRLADAHQRDPQLVRGTPTQGPHAHIEHLVHVIHERDQLAVITNLLLAAGLDRCLLFVTTRVQVTELVQDLAARGFSVGGLSGELGQAERTRTLESFRNGHIRALVATDVAARGLDVQDVRLVVHAYPPRDAEALIHRSGRTGRAGQQGRSVQLVTAAEAGRLQRLFRHAGIEARVRPAPGPQEVRAVHDHRLLSRLSEDMAAPDPGQRHLAQQLLSRFEPDELVARLLGAIQETLPCAPQELRAAPAMGPALCTGDTSHRPQTFELTYGSRRGATPERVMAMVCRRGRIQRKDVGGIDIGETVTRVEVAAAVAKRFAQAASRRDQRDRYIHIRPAAAPARSASGRGRRHRQSPRARGAFQSA